MVQEVVKVIKDEIEKAKRDIESAEKLIKMGEEAGLDIAEQKLSLIHI